MYVGAEVVATILKTTSMGISIQYLNYEGLLLLKPNICKTTSYKRHQLLPGDVILCRILRLNGKYFDAAIV